MSHLATLSSLTACHVSCLRQTTFPRTGKCLQTDDFHVNCGKKYTHQPPSRLDRYTKLPFNALNYIPCSQLGTNHCSKIRLPFWKQLYVNMAVIRTKMCRQKGPCGRVPQNRFWSARSVGTVFFKYSKMIKSGTNTNFIQFRATEILGKSSLSCEIQRSKLTPPNRDQYLVEEQSVRCMLC